MNWSDEVVLVTGGTGSFGRKFAEFIVREYRPKELIVFSRDEFKQQEMRTAGLDDRNNVRYLIGDVRDAAAVRRAFRGVTLVVHAAALKQVPVCEAHPFEAVHTNIIGSKNVIDASLDQGVRRTIAVSTDKAVNPMNVYGATKLCAERMFVLANRDRKNCGAHFSCVRFGNFAGSRGSLIPVLMEQRKQGKIKLTDARMTRFWITLEEAARFSLNCLTGMRGGEIFVPKSSSLRVLEVATAIAPGCEIEYVGIRPGEKLHESLISEAEVPRTFETAEMYVILPDGRSDNWPGAVPVPSHFRYTSDSNHSWMTEIDLAGIHIDESSATNGGENMYLIS